ncbi:MAG: symmetrical bis(5'-nucleosyl)-tetraphosphatase [Acidobacteria bacterium]|nr:symmetrical bis(5'-nucleosyl)-tetraphosphatase [Acidobacteriota bacterium]
MATWVIGDVHGCLEPLLALTKRIGFDPGRDRLWFLGDLVNRGPDSLGVLRWVAARGENVSSLLGNHDLKLLACSSGVEKLRRKDTFGGVLDAPDRDELIAWLARRPLLVHLGRHVLVHAGLLPTWSLEETEEWASRISRRLNGAGRAALLSRPGWKKPRPLPGGGDDLDRLAAAAGILTGVRIVDGDGAPDPEFTGTLAMIPRGFRPWYEGARIQESGRTVVFGHWANHGFARMNGAVCLDSACLYGGALSALRLEDGAVRSVPCPRAWPARAG